MGVSLRRRSFAAAALVAVAALAGMSACSQKPEQTTPGQPITLNVDVFGQFGYEDLYKQYEAANPGIKIVERGTGARLDDHTTRMTQQLAAGSGMGDIVAIEEGTLIQFKAQSDKFVNLLDQGASADQGNFLPWKWEQGLSADGKSLMGLGTDVGGMGICYRTDLYKAAGLPTDREAVSALFPTWEAFITKGEEFKTKTPNVAWADAGTNFYNVILMQKAGASSGYTYYDKSNNFVMSSNPAIKESFDLTMSLVSKGLTAKLFTFSDEWAAGTKQSKFANVPCPAWMTGVIEGNAGPEQKAKWDIAKAPGGGNWGGSFLSVPKQSTHQAEAAKLARFLTSPQGQIAAWKSKGNLPSSPQAQADPSVADKKNEYFSNAPTGTIFAAGAKDLKPVYMGPKNQAVRTEVENAIRAVEQGQLKADAAWAKALADAEKASK